jgi:tetratricopeptide (TPR) repeat protein
MAAKKRTPSGNEHLAEEQELTDPQRLAKHAQENPAMYAAAVVLVVVVICGVMGLRHVQHSREVDVMTTYASAELSTDDPADQVRALSNLVEDGAGSWDAEALYMLGETAIQAKEYDKARTVFTNVREKYSSSVYVPRAVEGIAFLDENAGDNEAALKGYEEVGEKWPNTVTGKRVYLHIARVHERMENVEAAIAAFQKQEEVFPESAAAMQAQRELARLERAHPDLFPEEEEVVEETPAEEAPAEEAPAEEAPAEEAPAEEAPAEETPAEEAPAEEAPAAEVPGE